MSDLWQSFVKLSLPLDHPEGYSSADSVQYEIDWRHLVESGYEPIARDDPKYAYIIKLAELHYEGVDIEAFTDSLSFLLKSAVLYYADVIDYFVYRNPVRVKRDGTVIA